MTLAPDLSRLLEVMARLRDPARGCPWDREQSFRTIAPYTIEEAYEVAEACERGDAAALKDELGDLLFQVVFHARMAEEDDLFAFNDMARAITEKMLRRHPHVFGDAVIADAAAQTNAWEEHKAAERAASTEGTASALDGVGTGFPALTRALKLQRRAARVGFDWPDVPPIFDKIDEEMGELRREIASDAAPARLEDEIGDLLFAVVNLARRLTVDPEQALRGACRKFERRFRHMEGVLAGEGSSPTGRSLTELEALWQRAKAEERQPPGASSTKTMKG
ncbi:MAG TPA: nucleoside triphosphate pyrophosphohydrolase [Stellaceae bacterium]|nr:nucleoside triphosphate pyrophosphohydrolase [Stellaceae bacterium]